jgi:hypothetical protein
MIVARHEVPGDMRKIARPSGSIERIFDRPSGTKVKAVGLEFGHLLTPGGPA